MKPTLVAALLALALSANAACSFQEAQCNYDLATLALPLNALQFYQYSVASGNATGTYDLNICSPLNTTTVPCPEGTAVCQTTTEGESYSCGLASTQAFSAYQGFNATGPCPGVSITYTEGTKCPAFAVSRSTLVNVACSVEDATPRIASVMENGGCGYTVQMYSAAACNTTAAPMSTTSASVTPSATVSVSVSVSMVPSTMPDASMTATPTVTPTMTRSATVSAVMAGASATPTMSLGANVTQSVVAGSPPPAPSDDSSWAWVWWTIGAIVLVLLIVGVLAGVGFVLYKKKQQQTYDSIGYE